MKKLFLALFTSTLLLASGCSSLISSVQSGPIEEDQGERTLGRLIEDDSIETKSLVNIHAANDAFDDAHVSVVSYNGYVLLAGQVPTQALKAQATDVVRKIRGVRRIYNELEIAAPSSGMTRTSDAWITAKVKSYLLADSSIEGFRVKVVTENGVVYLLGLATRTEVERIVQQVAGISGVQRVVKLFELID